MNQGAAVVVEDVAGVEALPGGRSRAGGVVTEAPGASPGYKAPQRTVASAEAGGASAGRGRRPGMGWVERKVRL